MSTLRRVVRAIGLQALGGLVVWLLVAVAAANVDTAALDLVTVLLLFGQIVVVPLGLLLLPFGRSSPADALLLAGRFGFRLGAVAVIASLAIPRGELAAAVAAVYLVPALLVAASSVLRAPAARNASDIAGVAAALFLAVGAFLFVLHRGDVALSGFPELAVQLAAVHFHFIGFGLVLMAGALARRRPRLGGVAATLLAAGTLAAPIGSLIHPVGSVVGALALVAGLALLAAGTFMLLGDSDLPAASRRLLFVSVAFSVFVGGMATVHVVGRAVGASPVDIGSMARLHGVFAAIGVVFCGLIGWRLATEP
jgi:hypothetical protein